METFWKEFYLSFTRMRGAPATILGLMISAVYFALSTNQTTVHVKYLAFVGIPLTMLLLTLFDFAVRSHGLARAPLPSIKQSQAPPSLYGKAKALLLLEDSPIFAHESLVSIYLREDQYEMLIGTGVVIAKQQNGLIQVLVTRTFDDSPADTWTKICGNDTSMLKRVLVKPSIPKAALGDEYHA